MKWLLGAFGILMLAVSMTACQLSGGASSGAPTAEPTQLIELPPGVHYERVTTPSGETLHYSISVPPNTRPHGLQDRFSKPYRGCKGCGPNRESGCSP